MDQDYIRTARAKGVKERDVIYKHALRNGMLPSSHLIIGGIATSLIGSLFVEITFNYTGIGYYFYRSLMLADYFLINGFVVFFTLVILFGKLIALVFDVQIPIVIFYKDRNIAMVKIPSYIIEIIPVFGVLDGQCEISAAQTRTLFT